MATIVRKLGVIDGGATDAAIRRQTTDGPHLRVAIASRDGKGLNAHFGYAERLMVYQVTRRTHRFVQVIAFVSDDAEPDEPESEDRIGRKVAALAGCHLLFVLAIGPPAAAKVIRANIHPVTVPAAEPIGAVISRVQTMMSGERPAWLERILAEKRRQF